MKADFDPDLTQPRRFVAPPPPSAQHVAALASREKSLLREISTTTHELEAVRQELAQLPTAA